MQEMDISLKKLDSFFLAVGAEDDYTQFGTRTLADLKKLVPCEQAAGIFVNASGKVMDCCLIGIDEKWGYIYKEYYASIQENFHLGMKKDRNKKRYAKEIRQIIWAQLPENEFIKECIGARGVQYSLDFSLFDNRGQSRLVLALDRISETPFSEKEIKLLNMLAPHLDNIHRKFFLTSGPERKIARRSDARIEMETLTKREKEVVSCLCEGIPTGDICEIMNISQSTLYRHIANIYKKLDISSMQELLVRFLGK
ncbi:MAG: helix-turn-helix transcriptional regulator [Eubacteriales bacterium]|nr:helix-turn-helix transcriptional regulator [Eubacteriales bacterium]